MRNKIIASSDKKYSGILNWIKSLVTSVAVNKSAGLLESDTAEQKREKAILYLMTILDDYTYNPLEVDEDDQYSSSLLYKKNNQVEISVQGKISGETTEKRDSFCRDLYKEIAKKLFRFGVISNYDKERLETNPNSYWNRRPLHHGDYELVLNFYLTDEGFALAEEAMKRLVGMRNARSQEISADITKRPMLS